MRIAKGTRHEFLRMLSYTGISTLTRACMPVRMVRLAIIFSLLSCAQPALGQAGDPASPCDPNLQARIAVTFRDREVVGDTTKSVADLNRVAGNRRPENHNVYGLTFANPDFKMVARPLTVDTGDGFCAVPEIRINLGLSDFRVYLARELTDPCQQAIIREHEEEHVKTWRSQLRAGAQLLATTLRNNAGPPRYYASAKEAEAGVNAWSLELVTPWIQRILVSVRAAQASIDTQTSYDSVTSRLRSCGRAVRGGSR